MEKNSKVEWFFEKETQWKTAYTELRQLVSLCGLQEELKWGVPCYTFEGRNVVLIHGFKNYCALLFSKGVLLKDEHKKLIRQTEYVQSARQLRFENSDEILAQKQLIQSYVNEAVEIEKKGLKVDLKPNKNPMPEEFKKAIDEDKVFEKSFFALTPGRQRAYLIYFSSAKQAKTRMQRIEKHYSSIIDGKGMDD